MCSKADVTCSCNTAALQLRTSDMRDLASCARVAVSAAAVDLMGAMRDAMSPESAIGGGELEAEGVRLGKGGAGGEPGAERIRSVSLSHAATRWLNCKLACGYGTLKKGEV